MARMAVRLLLLAIVSIVAGGAAAQPAVDGGRDVVVLALLSSKDSNEDAMRRAALKLFGQRDTRATLQDVQFEIVRKTADFGPVLLLAPDDETHSDVFDNCAEVSLCELLATGKVRVAVVPHDTPWIRDYGPMFDRSSTGEIKVLDSAYYDIRQDESRVSTLQKIAAIRLELIDHALSNGSNSTDPFELGSKDDIHSNLELLREYAAVLREQGGYGQRTQDDRAPFSLAQALFGSRFRHETTALFIDGGNLLRLPGGTCLTTTSLALRNPGKQAELAAALRTIYQCSEVLELQPLPGPVIEHVDMFVLPAGSGRLLLPDYRLSQPHIQSGWGRASSGERDLTFQAALTMARNARVLRDHGYDVEYVPALIPRIREDGGTFYPTMLNALVRSNGEGNLQVLVPTYGGLPRDVQAQAISSIRNAFGPLATVTEIEATVAAQGQGAIHCLTITVPYDSTNFRESDDADLRELLRERSDLDTATLPESTPTLVGSWTASRMGRLSADADEDALAINFTKSRLSVAVDGRSAEGTYVVSREESRQWIIDITFEGGVRKTRARVEWLSPRAFRLVMEDGDRLLLTRPPSLVDLDTGSRQLELGVPATGSLGESDEVGAEGGYVQAWQFKAEKGQSVAIKVNSSDFDTLVSVIGPGMDQPKRDDDGSGSTDSLLDVVFPEEGTYSVVVGGWRGGSGSFTIQVTSASLEPGDDSGAPAADAVSAFLSGLPVEGRNVKVGKRSNGQLTPEVLLPGVQIPVQAWRLVKCDGPTRVELSSTDFDPILILIGGDLSEPLISDDADSTNSAIEFSCTKQFPYTVIVGSTGGSGQFVVAAKKAARPR